MKNLKILIIVFILTFFKINYSYSLVEIDITKGNIDPLPIAVSALSLDVKSKNDFKNQLDLEDLGLEISKVTFSVKVIIASFPERSIAVISSLYTVPSIRSA